MRRVVEVSVVFIVTGLALALLFLALKMPLGESFGRVWQGAVGDRFALLRTLTRATPLVLTGVGMTVAWRAGAYNVGGEGQFVAGGLTAAAVAPLLLNWPAPVALGVATLAAAAGGALPGAAAGWMQARRGVPTVVSTLLLSSILVGLTDWAVRGPWQEAARKLPQTELLARERLYPLLDRRADANWSSLLAVAAVIGTGYFLSSTKAGFAIRAVGANALAAETYGWRPDRVRTTALALSGALCGLAAAADYLGVAGRISGGFAQGWGFMGIAVALVGGLSPWGAGLAGIFFGALLSGCERLGALSNAGPAVVYVVQGVAVLATLGVRALSGRFA